MKIKIIFLLMIPVLALHGCATKVKMAAVAPRDQKIGYDETLTSQKKHFVSLSPYSILDLAKDKTIFMVSIQNGGEAPINITNNTMSVVFEETAKKGTSKAINIQALNDFIDDLEKEYNNKDDYFINSKLEKIKNYIENWYSRSGPKDLADLYEDLADLFEDLKNDIEDMRHQNEVIREMLPGVVMKPQTIMAGNSYSGIVVCDTRDLDPKIEGKFRITVLVDGEEHRFTFNRSLYDKK